MKRANYFILFTLLITANLFSAAISYSQWTITGGLPGISIRPQISIVDENNVWTVGGMNGNPGTPVIYKTTNGGLNWIGVSTNGIMTNLIAVYAREADYVFIGDIGIGSDGYTRFYKTVNGGANWTTVDSVLNTGSNSGVGGIKFSNSIPAFGIALLDGPGDSLVSVFKTTNGGFSWTKQHAPLYPGADLPYSSLDIVDSLFYSFGSFGSIPRLTYTTNGGATWNSVEVGLSSVGNNATRGVAFKEDKLTGIVGSTSFPIITRTTNGGLNWNNVSIGSPGASNYSPIMRWAGPNLCYLTAPYTTGGVFKSTNSGLNWVQMTTSGKGIFNFDIKKIGSRIIGFSNSQNDSSVLKFTDTLLSGKRFFANLSSQSQSLFIKSSINTNGNFVNFGPGTSGYFMGMEFDNSGKLYCIRATTNPVLQILDTTTGSLTNLGAITGITSANQNSFSLCYNTGNDKMYMISFENGFGVRSFLYTLNLNTREATFIGEGDYNLMDIAINSSGQCYGIAVINRLIKVDLEDGSHQLIGPLDYTSGNVIQSLCFDREVDVLYVTAWNTNGNVPQLRSINTSNAKTRLEAVFNPNLGSVTGFAIPFNSSVGIQNISSQVPDGYSLQQNYPNPFNPVTNLEFGISKLGFVSLKVYDVLGKEVAILVNSQLAPGTYKYDFDGSNLSSGVYFYKLEVGGFADTKRMYLVK